MGYLNSLKNRFNWAHIIFIAGFGLLGLGCQQTLLPLQNSLGASNTLGGASPQPSTSPIASPTSSPVASPSASPVSSPVASPSASPIAGNPQPGPGDTIVFQDGFESGDLSKWDVTHPECTIETDPTKIASGNYSLKVTFTPTDGSGDLEKWYMPGYGETYFSADIMFSSGFENMRPDGYGMHLVFLRGNQINNMYSASGQADVKPNGTDYFLTSVDPQQFYLDPTLRPFTFYTYFPDMTCGSSSCYGNTFLQPNPTPLVGGVWQHIVVHFKANTPGLHDGSQTLWINGQIAIDVQNMRWRDTYNLKQNQLSLVNYMDAGSPITEYIWWDNITVWVPGAGTP